MRCLGLLCLVLLGLVSAAKAQDHRVFTRGEAVVTGFSGTRPADPSTVAGNPLDQTFVDLEGASARILKLEPGAPPAGQLVVAPSTLDVKARDVGQVFAIGLDDRLLPDGTQDTPNIYLGATSAFGLQIVMPSSDGSGRPERLKKGDVNAQWMAGQFGTGGGPGSIYKIDGKTGAVSLFATVPGNSGPGIGDIAFDDATRQFFVSDLDTGLIYRLDEKGNPIDAFDHGQTGRPAMGLPAVADDGNAMDIRSPSFDSEDSSTWGFTQPERRVWGLGLHAGRLYYATSGPEIWSVSINLDGTFGNDPRREIEVSGTPNNNPISHVTFDAQDHMYVAQRGGIKGSYDYSVFADAKQSAVFRFTREIPDDPISPGIWVPIPDEYAVGFPPDHRNGSGGVALGYGYDEKGAIRSGACNMTLWATGDSLLSSGAAAQPAGTQKSPIVHGLQGTDLALTRPDNEQPAKSWFFDYDGLGGDPQKQGHVGDIEIWQPCDRGADLDASARSADVPPDYFAPGEAPSEGTYNLRLENRSVPDACVAGGLGFLCDYVLRVTNTGPDPYVGPIVVNDEVPASPAGAVVAPADASPWTCFAMSPSEQQCTYGPGALLPGDSVDLHVKVELPVAAPVCTLDNRAGLVWARAHGDADPADDFDLATATVPAPNCPPSDGDQANLQISKRPLKEVCTDKGAFFECPYQVTVRNVGAGVYNGDIQIDDVIPAGTTASFAPAAWNCMGPPPSYSCQRGQVALLPGQTVSMNAIVKVPKPLAGPLNCQARNKVKIVGAPGGADQNTDPSDDKADAAMVLPSEIAQCPSLPKLSNLKLTKTGPDGECPVLWGNWICKLKVTVQNFGEPYTSPVQFIDALPIGNPPGAVVSFQPPVGWTCGGPVLSPNLYQCSSDNPDLAPLEKVEIPVIVRIPVAPVAKCEVTSTAEIVKAPGGTLLNSFDGDDTDSAKAQLSAVVGQGICLSNLKLTQSGPAEACPVSGDNWECQFKVTVQNFGKAYKDPIQFVDALPFGMPNGATVSFQPPAGWRCDGPVLANLYQCNSNNPDLEPGAKAEIPVVVRIPVASGAKCEITSSAKIVKAPGGSPHNFIKLDDEGSAEAQLAAVFPVNGSQGICLTSNLHLEATDRNQLFGGTCPAKDGYWICHFGLAATNIGEQPFAGEITIADALPLGIPAGASVTFEETPGWDCGGPETGSGLYQCGTTDAKLDTGESVLIRGAIKIPVAPVQKCSIANTARIVKPDRTLLNTLRSDDSAAVTMALQNDVTLPDGQIACSSRESNLKLETTPWLKNNKFCRIADGMWVCDWKLQITNTGPDSFESPIEFADELVGPPHGASLLLSQPANWTCTQPPSPNAGCRSENPKLGAGESVEFSATARIPIGPITECAVNNYARISTPKAGTELNSVWLDDISSSTLRLAPYLPSDDPNLSGICLLSAVGEPALPLATPEGKRSNLSIIKTAAASQVTANGQSTKFTITVTNKGPGIFNAPIEVRDTLFDGATVEPSNGSWSAPWVCEGQAATGHPEQGICTHPQVKLDPGESVPLELVVEAPDSFIAPSGAQVKCGYDNKVEILRPAPGSPKNSDAGDDVASAKVNFVPFERHGKKFCELGLTTPQRPKTNLTIAKTVGACAAAAGGQNCAFAVTVTNAGTNVYEGPIEIRDTLFDGAMVEPSNGSWSAPWTCEGQSAAGHPEQGICTHPPVKLDPGEHVVLNLEIEAPDSFVAPSGSEAKCSYKNKVEIVDPAGGSAGNTNAGDDTAFVEAKFSPFEKHGRTFCAPPTNLTVTKTAGACATTAGGQNCSFTIAVANSGPNVYKGPIVVRDTLFDGVIVEPSNGSWSPPWTCAGQSAAGHPEQGICTHPPVKLDPGEKVALTLQVEAPSRFVSPSSAQARCGYKNKVEILDPAGGTSGNTNADDDAAVAEAKFSPYDFDGRTFCGPPTNLAITKTAGTCATTPSGQNCGFTITVTNKGPSAYKGPIEIRDTLFNGQIVEPSNGSFSAPWTCEGQSASGHPEKGICTHPPVKLDPGESVVLNLQAEAPNSFVAPSASQAKCGYTNKVEILDPEGGSNWNTNAADDIAFVEAKFSPYELHGKYFCIPPTNLSVAKSAGTCAGTAGGVNCSFTVTVTNKGPNAHYGPIKIRDTLFDGAIVEPSNGSWSAPWTCEDQSAAGHPEQGICTHPSVKLDPGASVVLNLQAEAPNSYVVPSGSKARCDYTNKVEILDPAGGSDGNTDAGDDTASSEAKFPPFEKLGRTYCGPPSNLAIAKTAGPCAATASGQNCGFTIIVTNKGPNAYRGPIEIRDTLFDGKIVEPSNGSWSMPWTCAGQSAAGHPERTLCTHPPLALDSGASVVLNLQAEAPNSYVAPSGSKARCDYTNKVEILDPAGGSDGNTDAGDDTASAKATFAPFQLRGKPFCGFVLTPPPAKPAEVKKCPANSVGEYPDCRCPSGFTGTPPDCRENIPASGAKMTCGADETGTYPDCRCAKGFSGEPPNCRPMTCPPGTKGNYPDCRKIDCPANQQWIDGACQCPDPLKWNGRLCAAATPKVCPADSIGKYPNCRCRRGTAGTPGNCVRIIEPRRCPADSRGVYPNCRCKRGMTGEPGNCVRIFRSRRCPEGFRGTPPNCRRAS